MAKGKKDNKKSCVDEPEGYQFKISDFSEFLGGSKGLNPDAVIESQLNRAMRNKDFFEVMEGLCLRGIKVKAAPTVKEFIFEFANLLYFGPAIREDFSKISPLKNADMLVDWIGKDCRADINENIVIKNFMIKHRATLKKILMPEIDTLIKNCSMMIKRYRATENSFIEEKAFVENYYGWNHGPGVSIKKQAFWTHCTIKALEFLERHNRLYDKNTRDKNLLIIAYFMQALYPHIWTGDVKGIKETLRKKVDDAENKRKTEEFKK